MNARELGILMGCAETGITYDKVYSFQGANEAFEKSATYVNKSVDVLNAAKTILDHGNVPHDSDVYLLVKSAAYKANNGQWDDTCDLVAKGVYDFCGKTKHVAKHIIKQAGTMGGMAALLSGGLKSVAALSAITGIGVGTLYWALKRESQEEALPNEITKNRIDQYHDMARDLEGSIENSVGY
tara:strand:+ start:23937 stop:24485 length:549 start_codon:yes stop_codon:yes gene_type:complete